MWDLMDGLLYKKYVLQCEHFPSFHIPSFNIIFTREAIKVNQEMFDI